MVYRRLPLTNTQRYAALRMLVDRKASMPADKIPLRQETIDRLDSLFPVYNQKIADTTKGLAAQTKITAKVTAAKKNARLYIADFIDALQNAIRRGAFPASVRAYYGLPVDRRHRLKVTTENDVITWGHNIKLGETKRVEAGGAPIAFPSLAEVDAAVDDFKTKNDQQSHDKFVYNTAQDALAAENKKADQLIRRCWNEVETAFDEGDKPSLRRIAREWGVVYVERKEKKLADPRL